MEIPVEGFNNPMGFGYQPGGGVAAGGNFPAGIGHHPGAYGMGQGGMGVVGLGGGHFPHPPPGVMGKLLFLVVFICCFFFKKQQALQ